MELISFTLFLLLFFLSLLQNVLKSMREREMTTIVDVFYFVPLTLFSFIVLKGFNEHDKERVTS